MNRIQRGIMRGWRLVLGLILGIGITAAILVLSRGNTIPVTDERGVPILPTPTPIELVNIVIAVQELPRGYRIPANAVARRPWPAESAPFNAIQEVSEVENKIARTDIFREQPILSNMVVDDYQNLASELGRVGSDLAALLPPDRVAITVHVPATDLPQGIATGDRVDLYHSRPLQTTGTGPPLESATQRTIKDALVLFVGTVPLNGRFIGIPPTPTPLPGERDEESSDIAIPQTGLFDFGDASGFALGDANLVPVTLGVTPQDAVAIVWARNADLPLTLALRSATDTSQQAGAPVGVDEFAQEFGIILPWQTPNATATANFLETSVASTATQSSVNATATINVVETSVVEQVATEFFGTQRATTPTPTLMPTVAPFTNRVETQVALTELALTATVWRTAEAINPKEVYFATMTQAAQDIRATAAIRLTTASATTPGPSQTMSPTATPSARVTVTATPSPTIDSSAN